LHFPLYLEQHLTAQKVEELGAGFCVPTPSPDDMETKLNLLLNFDSCGQKLRSLYSRNQKERTAVQKQGSTGMQKPWLCGDLFSRKEITLEIKEGI
jgi:hypothetical protein